MYIVILFCQSVTPLYLKQLRLGVTNNGSKFSTAVQCRSTLVHYTNSDTCVAGSAATRTRVYGIRRWVAAHRYMWLSLECPVSVHRTNDCRSELPEALKLVSECRLHVSSGDGSFQIRFWRILSVSPPPCLAYTVLGRSLGHSRLRLMSLPVSY